MRTLRSAICALALLLSASSARAADDIDLGRATIVNSPADLARWPVTAHLTRVTFAGTQWSVDFDRRLSNPWPDFVPPGWDGPLQYTLGLCLNRGGWVCSAVVEFWQHRLEQEGPASHAATDAIAREWFYDARWGALAGQQPSPGEPVGIFVCAADCRNRSTAWPGAPQMRSDVRLVTWGQSAAWSSDEPVPVGPQPPVAVPTVQPMPQPVDPALVARLEALEHSVQALMTSVPDLEQRLTQLETADDSRITALASAIDQVRRRLATLSCSAAANLGVTRIPISCRVQ
jgi:hypothetical protein